MTPYWSGFVLGWLIGLAAGIFLVTLVRGE